MEHSIEDYYDITTEEYKEKEKTKNKNELTKNAFRTVKKNKGKSPTITSETSETSSSGVSDNLVTETPKNGKSDAAKIKDMKLMFEKINSNFDTSKTIEVSINLSPKWIDVCNTNFIQQKIHTFLKRYSRVSSFIMVQDYSGLGRLHYHGLLEVHKIEEIDREIRNLRKTFGRVEASQVKYWDSCIKYMLGVYNPEHPKYDERVEGFNEQRFITNKPIFFNSPI